MQEGKTKMSDQTDLFGHGPAQASLSGIGDDRMQAPQQRFLPDPEKVRRRLNSLIEKARSAEKMPWSERDARMWQTVDDEADQLRLEFAQEMERLERAA
jgi:hypothetical protein